jgi:hypothetical protein
MLDLTLREAQSLTDEDTMIVLKSYIDAAGTHPESKVIVVGGALAGENTWNRLEQAWRAILKTHKIPCYHAADFEKGVEPFSHLDDFQKNGIRINLARAITSKRILFVAVELVVNDFNEAKSEYPDLKISPFAVCVDQWLANLSVLVRGKSHIRKIAVYREAGERYGSELLKVWEKVFRRPELLKKWKISSFVTMPKDGIIPFQVADFVIYELYRHRLNTTSHEEVVSRPAYDILITKGRIEGQGNTKETLRMWFTSMRQDRIIKDAYHLAVKKEPRRR